MNQPICPMCESDDFNFLGSLGVVTYVRCRSCGVDYRVAAAPVGPLEPFEEDVCDAQDSD